MSAQFEISIDGVPRSYRDRREIAVETAGRLMAKYPHSAVAVKGLQGGERVAAEYKRDLGQALMPLTMRPTGLSSPVDKDRKDFTICSGDWAMGRIYEQRGGPDEHVLVLVAARHLRQARLACAPTATRQRSTRPRRNSRPLGGAGWRGRSCRRRTSLRRTWVKLAKGGPIPAQNYSPG